MTPHLTELFAFLRHHAQPSPAPSLLKRTFQQFVLDYGWWYDPIERPKWARGGIPQECFKNATDLMLTDDALVYCEGYALFKSGGLPAIHAWVTNGKGRAIDNTWPQPGVAYAGVPFQSIFVTMTALKNGATISLLGDYQNDFPLSGDLGDRPDELLELWGRGTARLAEVE